MQQTLKILKILFSSIAIFFAAMLVWLSFLDGQFRVSQTVTINHSKEEIGRIVHQLQTWESWSPWLNSGVTPNTVHQGCNLTWQHILAGEVLLTNMEHKKGTQTDTIVQTLNFGKPFECSTLLQWQICQVDSTTSTVQLTMAGSLPFQYRYLARRMETILFMDLDRSMKLLKDYVENGVINSKITIEGISQQPDRYLIGLKNRCTSQALDSAMHETFVELTRLLELNNIPITQTLSCYYDFGINANKQCEFMCAAITPEPIKKAEIPTALVSGKIKGSKTLKINYTGDYKHLGNAWVTGLTYIRAKGLKVRRRIPPYEIYIHTDANSSAPQEWKTELYIPLR